MLDATQQNYTTTKQEMLSISVTLEEFWSMLLDANIRMLTDQKLTFDARPTTTCSTQTKYPEQYIYKIGQRHV